MSSHFSALSRAAVEGNTEKIEKILEKDPDAILEKDKYNNTALHDAITYSAAPYTHMLKSVKSLLKSPKIDVNALTIYNESPIQLACYKKLSEPVKELIVMLVEAGSNAPSIHDGVYPETSKWARNFVEEYYAPNGPGYNKAKRNWNNAKKGGGKTKKKRRSRTRKNRR
jgi:hypothetical protein